MAARLGMSVAQAQREIDSREFAEWIAYSRISPIGDERQDAMLAQVALCVASAFSRKGANLKLRDYMLFREPEPPQTAEQALRVFDAFAKRHNKRVKKDGSDRPTGGKPDGADEAV